METIEIEVPVAQVDAVPATNGDGIATEREEAALTDAACSLAMLHAPQAALEAARRLYRHNRSGLRFFCENRRVVPVDQLEALGEFGEPLEAPGAVFPLSSFPEATRSTM